MAFQFKSISDNAEYSGMHVASASVGGTGSLSSYSDGLTTVESTTIIKPAPGRKKRFKLIDETQLPPDEAERLFVKRAYNRECAERARKRAKNVVQELQQQVNELQKDKKELRHSLMTMENEMKKLQKGNKVFSLMKTSPTQVHDIVPSWVNDAGIIPSRGAVELNDATAAALNLYSQGFQLPVGGNQTNHPSLLQSFDFSSLLLLQQLRK